MSFFQILNVATINFNDNFFFLIWFINSWMHFFLVFNLIKPRFKFHGCIKVLSAKLNGERNFISVWNDFSHSSAWELNLHKRKCKPVFRETPKKKKHNTTNCVYSKSNQIFLGLFATDDVRLTVILLSFWRRLR